MDQPQFNDQGQDQCVICHQYNDQILMLTCVHDPCIKCAAVNFAEEAKGKMKHYFYTCTICNQKTPLDISSVVELQKLAPYVRKVYMLQSQQQPPTSRAQQTYNYQRPSHSQQPVSYHGNYIASNPHKPPLQKEPIMPTVASKKYEPKTRNIQQEVYTRDNTVNKSGYKKSKMCKDHSDQQVSYFCFRCLVNICPECAIHGNHQGHEVKANKKAIVDVKKQFNGLIQTLQKNNNRFNSTKENHIRYKKQLSEKNNKNRAFITKQFQVLRGALLAREKQILKQLEQLHNRNLQILDTQISSVNRDIDQILNAIKSIQAVLKKDEIMILQEFGKKKQLLKVQIQKFSYETLRDNVSTRIKTFNSQALKQILDSLSQSMNAVKLETEGDLRYTEQFLHT